jgi:ATP-dependent RNA helicase RhlE
VDIVIATPGRLLDHVSQKNIDLSHVEILVLDEADRMLDMGFIRDIQRILALIPKSRQSLLFSATFSHELKAFAASCLKSPQVITVASQNSPSELVNQVAYSVDNKRKRELLFFLMTSKNWKQVLVFTRTKHGANRLSEQLQQDGISTAVIHGNKSQAARSKAFNDFKQGRVRALVATDVASRGLDINNLPHVVNYEVPVVPEDYVHRIGRTGRAGNPGEAISLVCIDELQLFKGVEQLMKQKIPLLIEPGHEPDPSIKAQPIFRGKGQRFKTKNTFSPHKKRPSSFSVRQKNNPRARVNSNKS